MRVPYSEGAIRPTPKGNKRSTRRQEARARLNQVSALPPVLEAASIDSSMRRRLTRLALSLARCLKYQHLNVSAPSFLSPDPPPCIVSSPLTLCVLPCRTRRIGQYLALRGPLWRFLSLDRPAVRHDEPGHRARIQRYKVRIYSFSPFAHDYITP